MSVCINRRLGEISKRMMCGAPKRIGPCPLWRAMFCIPWDIIKFCFSRLSSSNGSNR